MLYRIIKIIHISVWLIFLDQLTKRLVINLPEKGFSIIENFFTIRYSENFGMAFGIPFPFTALIFATILIMGALIYFLWKEINWENKTGMIAIALIFSGGIGNLIDRGMRGFVIDFIEIWKWPIFNFADIYITIGVLLLIVFYDKIKKA